MMVMVMMIRIREFDVEEDLKAVEEMERSCDVCPAPASKNHTNKKEEEEEEENSNTVALFVDQLGDPLCRVRHTPEHVMLVAEYGENREIVGVIRACIKMVTRGGGVGPTGLGGTRYVRVAYLLGLRVSPAHRRLGIGMKLVQRVESWCMEKGAEYVYMATDGSNSPSLDLFTRRLSYTPFRSPAIFTRPVHSHPLTLPPPSKTTILQLPPSLSLPLYRHLFTNSDFFPSDIDSLLSHPLTLGTFLAIPSDVQWDPLRLPASYAVMSLWDSSEVFRLRVSGASELTRRLIKWTRVADRLMPWLKIPSVRDVFSPFGVYLMYGLSAGGERGKELMRCLCRLAHNLAMENEDIAAVVCEVGANDEVRECVPHWKRFSCEEDVWCMKRLMDGGGDDWSKSKPTTDVIFVDPREF